MNTGAGFQGIARRGEIAHERWDRKLARADIRERPSRPGPHVDGARQLPRLAGGDTIDPGRRFREFMATPIGRARYRLLHDVLLPPLALYVMHR